MAVPGAACTPFSSKSILQPLSPAFSGLRGACDCPSWNRPHLLSFEIDSTGHSCRIAPVKPEACGLQLIWQTSQVASAAASVVAPLCASKPCQQKGPPRNLCLRYTFRSLCGLSGSKRVLLNRRGGEYSRSVLQSGHGVL
jgi:hypothetical protein